MGTVLLDFGAFPGAAYSFVTVNYTSVGTMVEAWVVPHHTSDHSADEHIVDPPRFTAGDIVNGVGFRVHGFGVEQPQIQPFWDGQKQSLQSGYQTPMHFGLWCAGWVSN
jgi:hypothetical protein